MQMSFFYELRSISYAGDLGGHPGLRSGLRPLPRLRPIQRTPVELTTEQGYQLLEEIKRFGDPLMVFTGGDPLKRPDLSELIRHSVKIGLRTNVTPSATPATHCRGH